MTKQCPLAHAQESILRRWEKESRVAFESSSDQDRYLLRDHLPNLLKSLCQTLCGESPDDTIRLSKIHGRQRFSIGNYNLEEVLGEYVILKNVVLDTIESGDVADGSGQLRVIVAFFDEAATTAAAEFSKLREDQLKKTSVRLEHLNSELERFSAVAAHDLRSPIGSMIGFLDVIAEDNNLSADSRAAVTRGEAAGRRCLRLIDKLLAYASVGHGEIGHENVSLDEVAGHAVEHLKAEVGDDVHIDVSTLGSVTGDPDLLTQLMQNLVGNSLKYRDPARPSQISIRGEDLANGRREISVTDNGVGFEPKLAEDVFQPFSRAHSKAEFAGTGLGLATCQKIVEAHGGRIQATTRPGAGTTISFSLPAAT